MVRHSGSASSKVCLHPQYDPYVVLLRGHFIWEQAARNRRWESRKLTLALPFAGEAGGGWLARDALLCVALPGDGGTDLGVCVASDEDGTPLFRRHYRRFDD